MSRSHTSSTHFTPPGLWQARPRARRQGRLPGCRSDDAQVSSVRTQQMVKRRDDRPDGCAAVPAPVPAPPQPYRAQPRRCRRLRDQLHPWARVARPAPSISAHLLMHTATAPLPSTGIRQSSVSRVRPSCQTMRHRISVERRAELPRDLVRSYIGRAALLLKPKEMCQNAMDSYLGRKLSAVVAAQNG
jgi:hypothetical protein